MHNLKKLSNREKKLLFKKIELQYGIRDLKLDYLFFKNNEGKIFIVNKEFRDLNTENINVNSIGLYFARLDKELRLTIEGSQIIGPLAKKNFLEVSDEQANEWLRGNDLDNIKNNFDETFIILKNKDDFIGCGKYKEGRILNYVARERRIK